MDYFYSIAPITQNYAIQYAVIWAFLSILCITPVILITIYGLFRHEVKILKEKYNKKAPFTFWQLVLQKELLFLVHLILLICALVVFINTYNTKYELDNFISKKAVIESPYFDSLDVNSKQFVKNCLLVNGELTLENPPLLPPFVYKLGDIDSNNINVKSYELNINMRDLKKIN